MTCRSPSGRCDQYMCVMYQDCPYPTVQCEHDFQVVGASEEYPWMSELVHMRCRKCGEGQPT
jgi:hypothetical protein